MTSQTMFVRLLGEIRDHLTAPQLRADLACVQVATGLDGPHAVVQLRGGLGLGGVAAGLLEWADTLIEVTASAWRPSGGTSVHLSVTGRLGDGLTVTAYSGVPYTREVFGDDLQPGGHQSVTLGVLRTWATGGEVAA